MDCLLDKATYNDMLNQEYIELENQQVPDLKSSFFTYQGTIDEQSPEYTLVKWSSKWKPSHRFSQKKKKHVKMTDQY